MVFEMESNLISEKNIHKVINVKKITENTFILSLQRNNLKFIAGQHINISIVGEYLSREYSIYNAEDSEILEILVKEVEGGYFSPKIKFLKIGDSVKVNGPFGRFRLDLKKSKSHKFYFIASGTGIAPLHSIIKSYPFIDYHVIHGVRYVNEAYEYQEYEKSRYSLCTSRDNKGNFNGRLTEYIKQISFETNSCFYICGNSDMIFEAKEILKNKGFSNDDINVEVYF